jgi:hypothetical protein
MIEVIRPSAFSDPSELTIQVRAEAELQPGIRLLGWNPPPSDARPGEALPVALFWHAAEADAPRQPITMAFILADGQTETVIESRQPLQDFYPVSRWENGELLTENLRLTVPRDQAAGHYTLRLRAGALEKTLGEIDVIGQARVFEPPQMAHAADVVFGDIIALRGYDLEAGQGNLTVRLLWQALRPPDRNYTVFIHVLDSAGNIVIQQDAAPHNNQYPTQLWLADEYVLDEYFMSLPSGTYRIVAGLYSQETGERLAPRGTGILIDDTVVVLGEVAL